MYKIAKSVLIAFVLAASSVSGVSAQPVQPSLFQLKSACNTGDAAACRAYNKAFVARHNAQRQNVPAPSTTVDPFSLLVGSPLPAPDGTGPVAATVRTQE